MGRMQMHNGAGPAALLVQGAMQEGLLGGWIAGEQIALPVQPRQALEGVSSQPSFKRTLMLPLLPAVRPRSKSERPNVTMVSRRRFSSRRVSIMALMADDSRP
jgi:hypothetical protein